MTLAWIDARHRLLLGCGRHNEMWEWFQSRTLNNRAMIHISRLFTQPGVFNKISCLDSGTTQCIFSLGGLRSRVKEPRRYIAKFWEERIQVLRRPVPAHCAGFVWIKKSYKAVQILLSSSGCQGEPFAEVCKGFPLSERSCQ